MRGSHKTNNVIFILIVFVVLSVTIWAAFKKSSPQALPAVAIPTTENRRIESPKQEVKDASPIEQQLNNGRLSKKPARYYKKANE